MVLEGISVWMATKETPKELVEKARFLLSAVGEQIEVKEENLIGKIQMNLSQHNCDKRLSL